MQPLDFIATFVGTAIAINVQKWGWKLQAKRLILQTLEDINERTRTIEPNNSEASQPNS